MELLSFKLGRGGGVRRRAVRKAGERERGGEGEREEGGGARKGGLEGEGTSPVCFVIDLKMVTCK